MGSANLYFAYGSNLNAVDWQGWCARKGIEPDVLSFRSMAYLPDHDVAFRIDSPSRQGGVLDIVKRSGQIVPGAIFEVAVGGWRALDRKEGAPGFYARTERVVLDDHGNQTTAATYCAALPKKYIKPQPAYVHIVCEGLAEHGLPTRAVEAAAIDELPPLLVEGFFVYGTLMEGECRFPHLQEVGIESAVPARAPGRLVDCGEYPGMLPPGTPTDVVQGEFVRVRDMRRAIERLDGVEIFRGFGQNGSLYHRTLIHVDARDGKPFLAWTYRYARAVDHLVPITSGDWRAHCARKT